MKLIELLTSMKETISNHEVVKRTTITTMEDLLIKVSEQKNEYFHVFIAYDNDTISVGQNTFDFPMSIIIADKLKADDSNKLYAHSNTLSIALELIVMLRECLFEKYNFEAMETPTIEIWTEKYSDSLIAGTKIDFSIELDMIGFCDLKPLSCE